jgi:uncharacterized protein YecT (DUF1311 family)
LSQVHGALFIVPMHAPAPGDTAGALRVSALRQGAPARLPGVGPLRIIPPLLAAGLLLAAVEVAHAGAYEDCVTAGDRAAVVNCLANAERQANAELASAEAAVAGKTRVVERATGKAGIHAALAKSVRDFAAYRASQCAYVREIAVREPVAEQAGLACRVDLTRRRVRELKP